MRKIADKYVLSGGEQRLQLVFAPLYFLLTVIFSLLVLPLASASGETINFQFPKSLSIGRLLALPPEWRPTKDRVSGKLLAECKGTVKVVLGPALMLDANDFCSENMNCLGVMPANTLACLILNNLSISNQSLAKIAHLSSLRRLELDDTDIDDDCVKYLSKLNKLEFLCLSTTLLKGNTLDLLSSANLKVLQFNNVNLTTKALRNIAKFSQLTSLSLIRTHLNDVQLSEISQMPLLEILMIAENVDISDAGIKKLVGLKRLHRLDVANTSVTAQGLLALRGLDLKELKLSSASKNSADLLKLKQAFPRAEIQFPSDHHRIPAEMFAPLH